MEWESDSSCCNHTCPGQGCRPPGRRTGWEMEFMNGGAIPGRGLLLTVERQIRGCEGGDCAGKCLQRKARQPWKQGDTAESRVVGGAITIASLPLHASIGSWTTEGLAQQMPEALNYRVGPHSGCPFKCMYLCMFSHTFYCCYKPLHLCQAFAVLWGFPFFFLLFFFFFSLFYNFSF